MNKFYTEEKFEYPADRAEDRSILKGPSWSVIAVGDGYLLEYISGELAGRLKTLPISSIEFDQLTRKEIDIDQILLKHCKN